MPALVSNHFINLRGRWWIYEESRCLDVIDADTNEMAELASQELLPAWSC